MYSSETLKNYKKPTMSVAYKNRFALGITNGTKRKSGKGASSKSDSRKEVKEDTKWRKNLKKVKEEGKSERLASKGCVYEQSSMFLFAIPK